MPSYSFRGNICHLFKFHFFFIGMLKLLFLWFLFFKLCYFAMIMCLNFQIYFVFFFKSFPQNLFFSLCTCNNSCLVMQTLLFCIGLIFLFSSCLQKPMDKNLSRLYCIVEVHLNFSVYICTWIVINLFLFPFYVTRLAWCLEEWALIKAHLSIWHLERYTNLRKLWLRSSRCFPFYKQKRCWHLLRNLLRLRYECCQFYSIFSLWSLIYRCWFDLGCCF